MGARGGEPGGPGDPVALESGGSTKVGAHFPLQLRGSQGGGMGSPGFLNRGQPLAADALLGAFALANGEERLLLSGRWQAWHRAAWETESSVWLQWAFRSSGPGSSASCRERGGIVPSSQGLTGPSLPCSWGPSGLPAPRVHRDPGVPTLGH